MCGVNHISSNRTFMELKYGNYWHGLIYEAF